MHVPICKGTDGDIKIYTAPRKYETTLYFNIVNSVLTALYFLLQYRKIKFLMLDSGDNCMSLPSQEFKFLKFDFSTPWTGLNKF